MPCAILLIIPVRKLEDKNKSIAFYSPYLGKHQTNRNVGRTEQIIANKRQNRISALKYRACADVIQLCRSSACSKESSLWVTEFASLRFGEPSRRKDKKIEWRGTVSLFKRARHVCVKNSDLPGSCACCSNEKGENSAIERTCCDCFTVQVKRTHI